MNYIIKSHRAVRHEESEDRVVAELTQEKTREIKDRDNRRLVAEQIVPPADEKHYTEFHFTTPMSKSKSQPNDSKYAHIQLSGGQVSRTAHRVDVPGEERGEGLDGGSTPYSPRGSVLECLPNPQQLFSKKKRVTKKKIRTPTNDVEHHLQWLKHKQAKWDAEPVLTQIDLGWTQSEIPGSSDPELSIAKADGATDQELTRSKITSSNRPEWMKPEMTLETGPNWKRPEMKRSIEPEWARPEMKRPTEPEWTRRKMKRPTEPEWTRPEMKRPTEPEWARPEMKRPTEPEWTRPEMKRPTEPEWTRPEMKRETEPEWARPEMKRATEPALPDMSRRSDHEWTQRRIQGASFFNLKTLFEE